MVNLGAVSRAKKVITLADFTSAKRGTLGLTVASTRKTVAIRALGVLKL
jgi:hypothetical protein